MIIIPAIDIIEGKCVRLVKGDYTQKKIYNEDPLEVAMQFEDAGLTRLHLVDLDGAKAGAVKNWKVLEHIATKTKLAIDFSGGLNSLNDVRITFESGAAYAAIGTMAVKNETEVSNWLLTFEPDKFIIGADVKDEMIQVRGWTEETTVSIFDLIEKYHQKNVQQFFCTDINKDGMLQGPSVELYKKIRKQFSAIDLIASGGVSSMQDLELLQHAGCSAAIVGKAIYENKISLNDLKRYTI